ncbi:hypothetical protein [Deinococcus yunweiensis]|uniref:hypothetical protein n=1 Tax=Deinococcus yunweiensis TaxID=367282 RepID=UPI00398E832D
MTCREAILQVVRELVQDRPDRVFWTFEVLERMRWSGSPYPASTIRSAISMEMCVDTASAVPPLYRDLERVGRGRYRLLAPAGEAFQE